MLKTLIIMLVYCFCFGQIFYAVQVNDPPPAQIINEQLTVPQSEGQLSYIFSNALRNVRVPGGIVTSSSCPGQQEEPRYLFPASSGTLANILDSIVALNGEYKWELHKGAVNLLPKSPTPPFLDITIQNFIVEKPGMSIAASVDELLSLSEVKQALARFKLQQPGPSLVLWLGDTSPHEVKLEAHNVTLREVLNEIAKAHGYAVWQYSESHCNGKNTFSITWVGR